MTARELVDDPALWHLRRAEEAQPAGSTLTTS
jgi:hypothetical protein